MISEKITDGYISKRTKPVNYNEADAFVFGSNFEREIPDAYIHKIPGGILTFDGLAIERGIIREESIGNKTIRDSLKYRYWLKVKLTYHSKKSIQNAIGLHGYYWNGYFHWMTEILTRLLVIKNKYKEIPIILPEPRADYQWESIKAFDLSNTLYLNEKEYIQPNQYLYLVDYIAPPGNYHINVIKGLANHLTKFFCEEKKIPAHRKIYISRKKANKRKVLNEAVVEALLVEYGYEILCMEDYTFKEQINICHQTVSMVSLHGAGLTNMMFMPEGSTVFEFRFEGDNLTNCYYTMASEFNHRYFYQLCKIDDNIKTSHDGNVIVDINLLENNLQLIEEGKK